MSRPLRVVFANLVCTFGNKGLLDYAESSVFPAFFDPSLKRTYGDSSYIFLNTTAAVAERPGATPFFLVYGRFVYSTKLRRTQVLEGSILKADAANIASAPSAFFVLILNNHKLVYVRETPYAPSTEQFAKTLHHFVSAKHRMFLDTEYERLRTAGEPTTRKQLSILHPYPELQVVPLSNPSTIDAFISRFSVLSQIEFRVLKPNQETQASLVFEGLQELRRNINSNRTIVTHFNKDGLDKEAAAVQIQDAAASGNEKVRLVGKDEAGNKLRGTNDDIKLEMSISLPDSDPAKADTLARSYEALVESGALSPDHPTEDRVPLLKRLFSMLF